MPARFVFSSLVAVVALAAASPAFADGSPAACLDAASKAQKLRGAFQLIEAREQLRTCAAAGCPAVVQSDCVIWLAEVEKALPTVVVGAKNGAGADLFDVKVTVDGQPFLSKLDGHAVPMNGGVHAFHFQAADGTTLDQQVMVKEGSKDQPVSVVLGAVSTPPSPAGGAAPAAAKGPWKTLGWAGVGVGGAGVILGAVFGALTLSGKSSDCTNGVCKSGTLGGLKTDAAVSDAGWIAGGVIAAGGVALLLFGPSGGHEQGPPPPATGFRVAPMFTSSGGGVVAGGSF